MGHIDGVFRAFSEANGDISLVLDVNGDDRRINLKPGLNNRELWNWLAERVGAPTRD